MVYSPPSVKDKVVLVTGASSGIGKATSLMLAEAGASVGLLDVKEPKETASLIEQMKKGKAVAVAADVRSSAAVEAAIKKVVAILGPLDGAANLAGVIGKDRKIGTTDGNLMDTEDSEWARVIDINLTGVRNCMASELRHMNPAGGNIVNAGSVAGQEKGNAFNSAYGASKAGVISLTRSVAREVASRNIKVNALAPKRGVVDTPMITPMTSGDPKILEAFGQKCALGRGALPEEISKMILWLLSDHNTYATGAVFNIDGAW